MKFDEQGHIVWTPRELFQLAVESPVRLITGYLCSGTPWAFSQYTQYLEFLEAVSERTGVSPRNLYLRGSCQIGFSIAPLAHKVWTVMGEKSDLDLVIVDAGYFHRFDREVQHWEQNNPVHALQGKAVDAYTRRQRDRRFNCCRDDTLPHVVCVHHQDTMKKVAALEHCGCYRRLSAFIYPDWHSARRRYEYDLRELQRGVETEKLPPPGEEPLAVDSNTPE